MAVRQLIPEGVGEMVPGPELSALLAGIDIHALTGTDAVEVLRARARQLSHEQARLLATMVQVGLCHPDAGPVDVVRLPESPPYAADEIRAALAWTRGAADREHDFAETLVLRMPAVFTALEAGRICRSKAWVFADLCADLTAEQAEVVFDRLLPRAGALTMGELATWIKKLIIALDPEWTARRYATAVRERNVIGYLNEDGTATVTRSGLPVDEAAAACAHVEELARAARRAGHPSRIGTLRADIYLGLLDGRWQHLTRDQIITDLLARATNDIDDGADPDHPTDPDPTDPPAGSDIPAGDAAGGATDSASAGDIPADGGTGGERPGPGEGVPAAGGPSAAQPARRVGVEVRVGLSTLLGRDRHPGEIPGLGLVTAEAGCALVAAQRAAEWRYALTDPEGQLILAGITRRRPHSMAPEGTAGGLSPCRGGIVELHLPAALLAEFTADPEARGEWAAVVADIAAQYTDYIQGGRGGPATQDPTARFAGAALSCPDPGPIMRLPGMPLLSPQRRPRPHHRPHPRRADHRSEGHNHTPSVGGDACRGDRTELGYPGSPRRSPAIPTAPA